MAESRTNWPKAVQNQSAGETQTQFYLVEYYYTVNNEWRSKQSKAGIDTELITAKGANRTSRVAEHVGFLLGDVAGELVRVVGARRFNDGGTIPEKPRSDFDGAGGMSSMPHVCDAVGSGSQVPSVQEHRVA
ncbi:hypothetical protein GQ457_16G008080 [Hibiscus cannabinus]